MKIIKAIAKIVKSVLIDPYYVFLAAENIITGVKNDK